MDPTQIVLIVLIAALLIIYPVMMYSRNKKQRQQMQEQTNSLKRGDRVLTASGVYGTIVDLHLDGDKTIVTIETGTEKNRGYISVDAYAIYSVIKEEAALTELEDAKPEEENVKESAEVQEEIKPEDDSVETKEEPEEATEPKKATKKPRSKKK